MELDQPRVTDPEVMRDLVEHDVSNLAAQTIGVAGSESRDRPAEDADLVGKHSAVRAAPSRQRYTAVQAEQRPPAGRLVLDDDLNVAHRRTEIGRQGAQRVVNRLFVRIVETRLRTCIHLRNDARNRCWDRDGFFLYDLRPPALLARAPARAWPGCSAPSTYLFSALVAQRIELRPGGRGEVCHPAQDPWCAPGHHLH